MEHQAWVLRSLLAQLERQEAVDQEAPNGIAGEFMRLKSQSTKYRTDRTYPSRAAEKPENIKKNRYKDIVPFDHSRVKLTLTTSKYDSDYINASFIKGATHSRAYIATQGPLAHTVLDFLRMLWEYNVKVVVMACREFEMGKKKCERYWPQSDELAFVCEPFTVYCDSEEERGDYLTRTLRVTYRNCSRTLKQLHYVNWPDHGVPDSISPILQMLIEMRQYQAHDDIPICIHCSAGCGRTGVLCVIDYTWNLLKKQTIPPDFCIFDVVQTMRTERPSVVQTKEQYELVYKTIKMLFMRYLESMEAPGYINVPPPWLLPDPDEEPDLLPQLQQLLAEERALLERRAAPSPSPPASETRAGARDERAREHTWRPSQPFDDARRPAPCGPVELGPPPGPAAEEASREGDTPPLNRPPSPSVSQTVCLMVEDPYFDASVSSRSSEASKDPDEDVDQWTTTPVFKTPSLFLNDQTLDLPPEGSGAVAARADEDSPPPLPERTPESYVLADDAVPRQALVIIPANAAAEALRELGGSPPSPVPPLPERTPESYELAIDEAPVKPNSNLAPGLSLHRIGTSSEWSGNSAPAATDAHSETRSWMRSKSLRVKTSFAASAPSTHFDFAQSPSSAPRPLYPPLSPLTPAPLPHSCAAENNVIAALPDRTPDSFVLSTEQNHQPAVRSAQTLSPQVGRSSEWDGTSQPKRFLDVVKSRSKSVRAKTSTQEPLAAFRPLTPPPVLVAAAGSAPVEPCDVRPSQSSEGSASKAEPSNDKVMGRTKSLKFFRHKLKIKTAPPPPPTQPVAAPDVSLPAFFKFGRIWESLWKAKRPQKLS
ncbi:tyrosine-protein phosphatase non-receptor type 22 isoform X2 [Betta splendens]|uniref:protein-tyrosine-phosphatase n=1 Tax=Betta splendens TaxID=158456 RepID=A0A6P7N3S3_BETSP|nr:tyrosine-protein phosphatase non-receptor type 22 isoform X2 [Betta splendens]